MWSTNVKIVQQVEKKEQKQYSTDCVGYGVISHPYINLITEQVLFIYENNGKVLTL